MTDLEKAKELGIENVESLSPAQLKKAIAVVEKAAAKADEKLAKLQKRAEELGMDSEGLSAEDLAIAISEEETAIAEHEAQEAFDLLQAVKISMLADFLGIPNIEALSADELNDLLVKQGEENAKKKEVDESENSKTEVLEGKTDSVFTVFEKDYQFSDKAPAAFRFAGKVKSQVDWLEDKDAMEIMVQGNLSFIKPAKK